MTSTLLKFSLTLTLMGLFTQPTLAQNQNLAQYPLKTIKLVVPFPAGGGTDAVARIVTQKMSEEFNEAIIVDNKIGAGGSVATEFVARAEPDGYTLLFTTSGHAIQPNLQKLNWDPIKDFAPISTLVKNPLVIAVRPDFKASSIKELVRMAKENPGKFTYGSSGSGSALNLSAEYFKSVAKVDIVHIPYSGNGPMTLALLKGEVDMVFDSLTGPLPNIHANKLRALAVTTLNRSFALPDTPTLDEAGLKGYDFSSWSGILAPAGTAKEIIQKLNHQMASVLENPSVREKLMNFGYTPMSSSSQEFQETIKLDLEKYKKMIKDLSISVN
jgi:tripartite-type tricarboxylate transporter receptor subunit TctC